jgi:superfamily II DNA or RNA helicase
MDALFEAIREECSTAVWTRAVQLSRSGTLDARQTHNDEIELRILTRGGMVSPLVVLSTRHRDWSCDCPSAEPVCVHVAAAAIAVRNALRDGKELRGLEAPVGKIVYRLLRDEGALSLERFVAHGENMKPLTARLTRIKSRDADGDISASQADVAVDLALGSVVSGKIPRVLMQRVLAALSEVAEVTLDGRSVEIAEPGAAFHAVVEDREGGFQLRAVQDPEVSEVFENGAVLRDGVLRAVGDAGLSARDIDELRRGRIYPFDQVADLVGRVLPALRERIAVEVNSRVLPTATEMAPRLCLDVEYDGECLNVLPTMVYGEPATARVDSGRLRYLGGTLPLRDEWAERRLAGRLESRLGMEVGKPRRLAGAEAAEFADNVRRWDGVTVQGNGLEACFVTGELKPRLDVAEGKSSFGFVSQDGEITRHADPRAVLSAWRNGDSLVPLIEGGWAPLPENVLERCGELVADLVAARDERGELPACSAPDLARLCEELGEPPPADFERLRVLAEDFHGIEPAELPGDLQATLRGYQVQGVNWLSFLSRASLGALLADDMGLGKTIQALCVVNGPALVVAPKSVLHNWVREIERFRPGLRQSTYHGPNRELDPEADITLTTYAILRIDGEILAGLEWDTVILDEAQNIKNSDSQVARAAFELRSRFRVTLSGTPVENRLDELWSQFHFINRGLLGGRRDFQERYARPIEDGDGKAIRRLRNRIRPFVLRRVKNEVASELPPRTEVVLHCTLAEREREIYEAIRAATRKEVVAKIRRGGNVLAAFEALLRLRQACCHPALLPGQQAEGSSKLALLLETLDNAVAGGHKALVFSQWTSLLDLTEPHLHRAGIEFARLDGSTRDRGDVVDRFQDPSGPPVMLVSLKAGGTGLNLTEADNVFLLDPWWNPAVEDQAADRSHRIGQDKPVLVQRLVAADTVEERLLTLQEKKRALAHAALDGGQQAAGLTRDDLLALLE